MMKFKELSMIPYNSITSYNDRVKIRVDPPLTGRQLRNKRRKLKRKK